MLRTVSTVIKPNPELLQMMQESRRLYDQALYMQRQRYFETKDAGKIKTYNYNDLWNIVKSTEQYTDCKLDIGPKTLAIQQVCKAWNAFIKATMSYRKNPSKFTGRPKMPNYLYKRSEYNVVEIDSSRFRTKRCADNEVRVPNGKTVLRFPTWLKRKDIRQIKLQYFYGKIKVSFVYDDLRYIDNSVSHGSAVGIDLGVGNLCAMTSNDKSFSCVVKGGPVKSANQFYNKRRAEIQSDLDKCNNGQHTSKRLERLTMKRNAKVGHYLHCVSKAVAETCTELGAEKIIIGHNDGWKQNANIGRRNNQNFVQIPFNTLIEQIRYKAERYLNMEVIVVEESYTSKCDHLAIEPMCHHDDYMGRRVKRGLFKSSTGKQLNADINGAIGILRKADAVTDAQLMGLRDRGDGVSPRVLIINP